MLRSRKAHSSISAHEVLSTTFSFHTTTRGGGGLHFVSLLETGVYLIFGGGDIHCISLLETRFYLFGGRAFRHASTLSGGGRRICPSSHCLKHACTFLRGKEDFFPFVSLLAAWFCIPSFSSVRGGWGYRLRGEQDNLAAVRCITSFPRRESSSSARGTSQARRSTSSPACPPA